MLGTTIIADAGYGSESNYRYLEDELEQHIALILPYGTMFKENSRKWQSDDRKVMNWDYHEDDYFINPQGVRFNFNTYRQWTDKYDFKRNLKEYFEANQRALFSVPETGQILCPMQDRC